MIKKILYYLSLILTSIMIFIAYKNPDTVYDVNISIVNLIIFGLLLLTLLVLRIKKYKFDSVSLMFIIFYLVFIIILIAMLFLYNNYLIYENMQFGYYTNIVLVLYNLLNIYMILCAKKR